MIGYRSGQPQLGDSLKDTKCLWGRHPSRRATSVPSACCENDRLHTVADMEARAVHISDLFEHREITVANFENLLNQFVSAVIMIDDTDLGTFCKSDTRSNSSVTVGSDGLWAASYHSHDLNRGPHHDCKRSPSLRRCPTAEEAPMKSSWLDVICAARRCGSKI
jgi:hypothetical protein